MSFFNLIWVEKLWNVWGFFLEVLDFYFRFLLIKPVLLAMSSFVFLESVVRSLPYINTAVIFVNTDTGFWLATSLCKLCHSLS